ncbi:polysaccharide deacetylase family protein [Oscillospiraceae bacterium MB08-C2-2]|nr:polysaccharide deacetylase family protein [Oscillospiraceae bacterium MB08-C2-2]
MKHLRFLALLLVVLVAVTGCGKRDGQVSSLPEVVSSVPPVASMPAEESRNLPSDVEDFTSDLEEDTSKVVDKAESLGEDLIGDGSDISDVKSTTTMSGDFAKFAAFNAEKKEWGSGGPTDDKLRPDGCTLYQKRYGDYSAYFIYPEEQRIYLTFDEGYENGYTPQILDTLLDHQVKAVFFITYDFAKTQPELVKRMINEGHTIGNHSTKHLSFPTMPIDEAAADLQNLHDYVLKNFGYNMTLFRFPMGEFSEQTLALAQSMGYKSIFWSFAYADYNINNQPDPQASLKKIVDKAHPGAIYLLHAVSKTNADILDEAIASLKLKGYTFSLLDA